MIAVALSGDSQQHWRLGHGGQADLVGDGRIGYGYTHSRFARGASARLPFVGGISGLQKSAEEEGLMDHLRMLQRLAKMQPADGGPFVTCDRRTRG